MERLYGYILASGNCINIKIKSKAFEVNLIRIGKNSNVLLKLHETIQKAYRLEIEIKTTS